MSRITRFALVPYSAEQMFELVNDVESYSQFLPGCVGSRVLDMNDNTMTASIDVAKVGIRKTFTTRNVLIEGKNINISLVDGPFRKLVGDWSFIPLDATSCKIALNLEFEFSNRLIEIAFGQVFKELATNMVNAFSKRARDVYE